MKKYVLVFLMSIPSLLWAQDHNERKFSPQPTTSQIVVDHQYYSYGYDKNHNITSWVAYNLNKAETVRSAGRSDDFFNDPELRVPRQATNADYYRSGYDRGHLAPAADMGFDQMAMDQSFFLTNIVPQNPTLNRGLWAELERGVRQQVQIDQDLYIVSGVLVVDGKHNLGPMTVPDYLYKIICDYQGPEVKMIAFLIPNSSPTKEMREYVVSVDQLEALTNIDFFVELEDKLEERLESGISTTGWQFFSPPSPTRSVIGRPDTNQVQEVDTEGEQTDRLSASVRCKGIAKSTGNQCKLRTHNVNGFCHHHQGQSGKEMTYPEKTKPSPARTSGRCAATTQKGTRCKRSAQSGRRYCWQHP